MSRLPRAVFLVAIILSVVLPCSASNTEETLPDANALAQMQAHALQANPRDQCFLYTQLVHTMTELAGHQMLAGDTDNAAATLKQVQHYAQLLQLSLGSNTKRLMNAQMLMHHTTRRLDEYVHKASFEDRDALQTTLKQLTQVEDELLNQVFNH
jgi:hypothetical protein